MKLVARSFGREQDKSQWPTKSGSDLAGDADLSFSDLCFPTGEKKEGVAQEQLEMRY